MLHYFKQEQHDENKKSRKSSKKDKNKDDAVKSGRNNRKSLLASASDVSLMRASSGDGENEEELSLMGASADDVEAEYIRTVCESETLHGDTLLAKLM